MILVDTSVIIDLLKNKSNEETRKFRTILDFHIPFGITSLIYQEVLQGVATQSQYLKLKTYLDTFEIYEPRNPRETFAKAALVYFQCRKKGITVRSSVDCLIIEIAREHRLKILHNDSDYERISKVVGDVEFF